jgi:hypothetical protein
MLDSRDSNVAGCETLMLQPDAAGSPLAAPRLR